MNLSEIILQIFQFLKLMQFFTPIQVVKVQNNSYSFEQLRSFGQDFLLQITEPRILSLADERKQLINWLKTITPLERQLAATFYNVEFVCLVRKMYQEWQIRDQPIQYGFFINNEQYSIKRQRVYRSNRQKQTMLLKEVILVSRGQLYEGITISDALLTDLEAFFSLMDELQGGIMLEFSEIRAEELKTGKIHFQLEIEEDESKSVGEWISKLLVKQIYLSFQTRHQKYNNTFNNLKIQEREYGKLWKQLNASERKQIVNHSLLKRRQEVLKDYMYGVGVIMSDLPSVYIQTDQQTKIHQIVDCNPKDLIYKLVFTPLCESLNLLNMYNIEIVLEIQAELSNRKQKQKSKKQKRKKKASEQKQKIQIQKQQILNEIKQTKQESPALYNTCENIIQNNSQQKQNIGDVAKMSTQINDLLLNNSFPQQSLKKDEQQCISFDSDHEPKQADNKQNANNIQWELEDYYKNIKLKCVQKDKCRKIILNRFIVILNQLNLKCKIFGSYAYQLTIPDSDLDVLVDSSILNYFKGCFSQRQQIINSLMFLQKILQDKTWTSDFVFLHGAKIPLLKFKADAGQHFEHTKPIKFRVNERKQKLGDSTVQVDLTIQPLVDIQQISHFGMDSTQSIKSWIEAYPLIKQLIIVIKSMIREKGLHISYQGGISSYATILLLVAFIKSSGNLQIKKSVSELAVFLRMFYDESWLIDIRQAIPLLQKKQENGPVLINPFDGRNLLERSFRFREIVELIENWKVFCKQ